MNQFEDIVHQSMCSDLLNDDMIEAADRLSAINKINIKCDQILTMMNRSQSNSDNLDGHTDRACINLPNLTRPSFSGSPNQWMNFWDIFNSSFHSRNYLSGVQKCTYFIGQMRGEAAQLFKDLNKQQKVHLASKLMNSKKVQQSIFPLKSPKN